MPAKKAEANTAAAGKPAEGNKKQAAGNKDAGAQAKGGPQKAQQAGAAVATPANQHPISSDPGEAAIQKKMDAIDAKIAKLRGNLDQIKKELEAENRVGGEHQAERKKLKTQLDGGRGSTDKITQQRRETRDKLNEFFRVKNLKIEEINKIKEKLPITPKPTDTAESYLKQLDDKIKDLENGLASNAFPLAQEKRKVEEISSLRQAKKIYKDYVSITEKIASDNKNINELKAELENTKGSVGEAVTERNNIRDNMTELTNKIDESNKKADGIAAKREPIRAEIKKLQDERDAEFKNLYLYRSKKREEDKARREKEFEKRKADREERDRQYKERVAERSKQEQLKIPYDDEIYYCKTLAKYLEGLLPPKQKDDTAASAAAVPEGGTILKKEEENAFAGKEKGKGKKQKATKVATDLKHNVEVFLQFETISLTAPSKQSDVEASIAELKAKQDYYTKAQAAKMEERAAAEAAAAAEAKAKESAAAAESSTSAPAANAEGSSSPSPSTAAATDAPASPKPAAGEEEAAADEE